jgi:hypothetical protein
MRGLCKVVIKKFSAPYSSTELFEFRDSSLLGYELGSGENELSWQLQNTGNK